jgi:hypothetical protein
MTSRGLRVYSRVLLDGRLGGGFLQRLDIGSDVQRLDIDQLSDAALFKPGKKRACGPVISHARILVADRGPRNNRKHTAIRMIASTPKKSSIMGAPPELNGCAPELDRPARISTDFYG